MFCCAQFSEDDSWYRARITESSTKDDTSLVQVIYVDFGNHEPLPVSRLRMLRKEHAELPMMAVLCALDGAAPPQGVRMQLLIFHTEHFLFISTHGMFLFVPKSTLHSKNICIDKIVLRHI